MTEMVRRVKSLGMETCMTLGMLLSTRRRHSVRPVWTITITIWIPRKSSCNIITTRTYADRLQTLSNVHKAGMKGMLWAYWEWVSPPMIGPCFFDGAGKYVGASEKCSHQHACQSERHSWSRRKVEAFDFIRMIAVARIMMPASHVRLSAGQRR